MFKYHVISTCYSTCALTQNVFVFLLLGETPLGVAIAGARASNCHVVNGVVILFLEKGSYLKDHLDYWVLLFDQTKKNNKNRSVNGP